MVFVLLGGGGVIILGGSHPRVHVVVKLYTCQSLGGNAESPTKVALS